MKKEKRVRGMVAACAFVLLMLGVLFASVVPVAASTTWTVDDSDGADFTSIQDTVDAASEGDTIIVRDGTYVENVKVNKNHLTIKSENGADSTIVQAADLDEDVFNITADYVNVSGFTAMGAVSHGAGFYLRGDYCNISCNTITNNAGGIFLLSSNGNTISGNTANANGKGVGIALSSSNGNTVSGNTANNNNYGIQLYYSSNNNNIKGNTANNNEYYGIYIDYSDDNTISGNTANENQFGIHLWHSDKNTVSSNIENDNKVIGILLGKNANSNTISNNIANNNNYGIQLYYSYNMTFGPATY